MEMKWEWCTVRSS